MEIGVEDLTDIFNLIYSYKVVRFIEMLDVKSSCVFVDSFC